jgi:hypothetical protein
MSVCGSPTMDAASAPSVCRPIQSASWPTVATVVGTAAVI